MTPPVPGWKSVRTKIPVHIPDSTGEHVASVIEVEVAAWQDSDGEIYLTGEAEAELDAVKARHMGLLSPIEMRELRQSLGLTQKEIALLLQLGAKTWTRWESGRERPSRSLNILLNALMDGRIDINYLRGRRPEFMKQQGRFQPFRQQRMPLAFPSYTHTLSPADSHESSCVAA